MKVSDLTIDDKKDKVEIVKQSQEERQTKFIGRIIPKKNHSIFEFNTVTNELNLAEFDVPKTITFENAKNNLGGGKRKIITKENCIYLCFLNRKNAVNYLAQKHGIIIK